MFTVAPLPKATDLLALVPTRAASPTITELPDALETVLPLPTTVVLLEVESTPEFAPTTTLLGATASAKEPSATVFS